MTLLTDADIHEQLAPLRTLVERVCGYEPNFIAVGEPYGACGPVIPEAESFDWSTYWAGINFALRPYFTLLFLVMT